PSAAGVADSDAAAVADGGTVDAHGAADAPITTASDASPPLADAKCWTVTYTPTGPGDWAGGDWQYPVNNWGDGAGLVIPAGATQVSLVAWGDAGGEKVSFNVGYGPSSNDRFGATTGDRFLTT